MKREVVQSLTATFEGHAQQTEGGVEYWLARDLQHLLGYSKWDNFQGVLEKAKTACEVSGYKISDHFADVGKMVDLGSGSQREIEDLMLTRYACYLIAQNGDHDLQCTATRHEQRVCDFARACDKQSGSPRHLARTWHPPRVIAGGRGCEAGVTAADDGREEVAQESGRSWGGGCVMSVWLNDAEARELEQTIAAKVAGILEE